MHKALETQLIRYYGSLDAVPSQYEEFLKVVDNTYEDNDGQYRLIERALDISSRELTEANKLLRKENIEIEKRVIQRTIELSEERSKLNKIAQNMNIGAILLNREGRVTFINNKAKKIIDFKGKDHGGVLEKLFLKFKGYPIAEFSQKCNEDETLKLPEVQVGGSIYEILFQGLMHSGDGDGGEDDRSLFFGQLIWIRDITDEKLLDRSKTELVAVASHQLRTPLAVTKGNTEMLLDQTIGKLNDEQIEILTQTAKSNEKLIALVNQMLDITKLEREGLRFELQEVDVDKILRESVNSLSTYAKIHNVSLSYENSYGKEIPQILGNESRFYQIFQNLIENSIKYCDPKKAGECHSTVTIKVSGDTLNIDIADSGIGIPLQEQKKIFQRFYRASNAVKFIASGTGLGLYIVKSIIEKLGGLVSFSSQLGKGTTFHLTFPIPKKSANVQ